MMDWTADFLYALADSWVGLAALIGVFCWFAWEADRDPDDRGWFGNLVFTAIVLRVYVFPLALDALEAIGLL